MCPSAEFLPLVLAAARKAAEPGLFFLIRPVPLPFFKKLEDSKEKSSSPSDLY